MRAAIESFARSRRRSEIVGEAGGVLVVVDLRPPPDGDTDDARRAYREFYPNRRSSSISCRIHTRAPRPFLEDFAASFADADEVVLHKIYASRASATRAGSTARLFSRQRKNGTRRSATSRRCPTPGPSSSRASSRETSRDDGRRDNWRAGRDFLADASAREPWAPAPAERRNEREKHDRLRLRRGIDRRGDRFRRDQELQFPLSRPFRQSTILAVEARVAPPRVRAGARTSR
jgi:hypothetical protein